MNTIVLRILAVLMIIGAIFFAYYGYQVSKPPSQDETSPPPVMLKQVVAAKRIEPKQVLTISDLETREVQQSMHYGYVDVGSLIGKVASKEIESGAVITYKHLEQYGPAAGQLNSGERAVAIKIDEVSGVGGYIKPGDHVDVLFFAFDDQATNRSSIAQIILRDLRVLSFGENIQDADIAADTNPLPQKQNQNEIGNLSSNSTKPNTNSRSAVLAVPDKDVTTLMLAANMGQLRLALRGQEIITQYPNTVLNTSYPNHEVANLKENHFIKSDALLKPDGLDEKTNRNKSAIEVTQSQLKTKSKLQSTQVIVHYGDTTKTLVTRDQK